MGSIIGSALLNCVVRGFVGRPKFARIDHKRRGRCLVNVQNSSSRVDEPVVDLRRSQASLSTQISLLLVSRIRMLHENKRIETKALRAVIYITMMCLNNHALRTAVDSLGKVCLRLDFACRQSSAASLHSSSATSESRASSKSSLKMAAATIAQNSVQW